MTETDHAARLREFADAWRANDEWRREHDATLRSNGTWFQIDGTDVTLTEPQLRAALDDLEQLRALTAGLRQEWGVQAEHSTSAFPTRTEAVALELAASYSRLREPGCLPTPHHVVTRLESDWQRIEAEAAPRQPERDGEAG